MGLVGNAYPLSTATQRSLTGGDELQLWLEFQGETHALDMSSRATIGDVHDAAEAWTGVQLSLQVGDAVLYERSATLADNGICAECVIHAQLAMNDLQIF